MKWKTTSPQATLRLVAAIILLAGWGSAGVVYFTVEVAPEDPLVEQVQNSKKVRRDLEIYGGKLFLVAHDWTQWFNGLWHGKALWLPIAGLTGFTSLVLFVVADHLRPAPDSATDRKGYRHNVK